MVAGEIRAHMARQRISAVSLSKSIGMAQATLSRKLSGQVGFTLDELWKIADVLDVNPRILLPDGAGSDSDTPAEATA